MRARFTVATPPAKPLMIFDGDCHFCRLWIGRWQQITGDTIDFLPLQDAQIAGQFPEIFRQELESAVHFIETDGTVYSGAEAVFLALAENPHYYWLLHYYLHSSLFAHGTERAYRFVANHRTAAAAITRLAWGNQVQSPDHRFVSWVFLRLLGVIFLAAFISLSVQMQGLLGHRGILPAKEVMDFARKEAAFDKLGLERYHQFPTLCWFSVDDQFLQRQCTAGILLSLMLIVGVAPAPVLFLLWLIYLSLTTVGRDFLAFQWDNLLLETGFLAIFLAPLRLRPRLWHSDRPPRLIVWLLRFLLIKLLFESGWVKWLSHDPHWRDLTALFFHYETQPLPTWISWYAHLLPLWLHKLCTALVLFIELVLPVFGFAPRRIRHFVCATFVVLQICIFITGNYCYFNVLMLALCLMMLDDLALKNIVTRFWRPKYLLENVIPPKRTATFPSRITIPIAGIAIVISLVQISKTVRVPLPWPQPILSVQKWVAPFRTFNPYGLFAIMTTTRTEIVLEGSNDGLNWIPYEFKYKPGDLNRKPVFVQPHQPRLDWQMWFAALGNYHQNPWLVSLALCLLKNSPEVVALLKSNPFPNSPPHYVKAMKYEYHFTDSETRRTTGAWWRREPTGQYLPVVALRESTP